MTKLTNLELDGKLDISDVLSVVTSRAETKLHAELDSARARLKAAELALDGLQKSVKTKLKEETQAAGNALVESLRPPVRAAGGTVVTEKFCEHGCRDSENGNLKRGVRVRNEDAGYGNSIVFTATVRPSSALCGLEESVETAVGELEERRREALAWRRKLANIPVLERRARAKLAEAKLSESAHGKEVLALLTDDLEAEFLALPSS